MNIELLQQMLTIGHLMTEAHDLDAVLALAVEKTVELMNAELCYLILVNEDGSLSFRAWSTNEVIEPDRVDNPMSMTVFNEVLNSGEPVLVSDAQSDDRYASSASVMALSMRSVMCVPLKVRGKVIGTLYVENRKFLNAFQEEDLEPLAVFANQAAASIENARIIEDLEARVLARTVELEASWHEAVEANQLRKNYLGQLAHDMRSPLSVAMMAISSMQKDHLGSLTERQQKWANRGLAGLNQLNELIQNVFDLSKAELNVLELEYQDIALSAYLNRIYDIGLGLSWHEGVSFEREIPNNLPQLHIDAVRIQQVVMNLISNALKFTRQGAVTLYARVEKTAVVIGVRDTGVGISREEQAHVFNRFHQFDKNASQRLKGAGLGLAICKELVEKHGGQISVASTPKVGSDFMFKLPIS